MTFVTRCGLDDDPKDVSLGIDWALSMGDTSSERAAAINAPLTASLLSASSLTKRCTRNLTPIVASSLRPIRDLLELRQLRLHAILVFVSAA